MSRFGMLLSLAIMSVAVSYAYNSDKTYRKMIEKYDVADEVKTVETRAPYDFWMLTLKNNELLRKFNKDMKKNRGAEKEANARTMELPRMYPTYDETIVESMQGFCDTLLMDMGIKATGVNCSLYVVDSDSPNYFSAMTEEGFAICLTSGLISRKGITREILMGYVANEFAHSVLRHTTRSFYAAAKRERKNELVGTLVGTAALALVCLAPQDHCCHSYDNCLNVISDDAAVDKDDKKEVLHSAIEFSQRYSDEQVYEADLIAYRFLENMGSGEEFINGLRILGPDYDAVYEANRYDRPSTTQRIDFLKYVKDNPEFGNKINAAMREAQASAARPRRR